MPLYEYHCTTCESEFELLVRTPTETPECPTCGGIHLDKLLSVPAAHVGGETPALPICQTPRPSGGCGAPWCGSGGCS